MSVQILHRESFIVRKLIKNSKTTPFPLRENRTQETLSAFEVPVRLRFVHTRGSK